MFSKYALSCRLFLLPPKMLCSGYNTKNFSIFHKLLSPNMKKVSICVEGNIGAGKSEMLNHFSKDPSIEILPEPVQKWQNLNGHNLLDLLYMDPSRWGFTFQSYVQLTMLQNHMSKSNKPIQMVERSIFTARYVFVENLYRSGLMPKVDYNVLCEWFNWITNNLDFHVDQIIYLRCSPQTALQRIKIRNRKEEQNISVEYLQSLHDLQEEWLIHGSHKSTTDIMVLDAEKDLRSMLDIFDISRDKILCG
ncbi:thymidine kinase 2, mitochondrial-like [Argonauta hians]